MHVGWMRRGDLNKLLAYSLRELDRWHGARARSIVSIQGSCTFSTWSQSPPQAHVPRTTKLVEVYEAAHPADVRLLGAQAVVATPQMIF
jgi:hypothetical protein